MEPVSVRTSVNTAPIADDLEERDGWIGMHVQFLVDHMAGANSMVFGRTVFAPGQSVHLRHRHAHAEEAVLIVRGHGVATNGDDEVAVGPGDVVFHPRNKWHGFRNTSDSEPVEMLWVWGGAASRDAAGYELEATGSPGTDLQHREA